MIRASCVTGIGKSRVLPFFLVSSVCRQDAHLAWVCGPFRARTALFVVVAGIILRRPLPLPCSVSRGHLCGRVARRGGLWWWLAGDEESKGIWWMPWRQEAMKDVARCEKPWGAASRL